MGTAVPSPSDFRNQMNGAAPPQHPVQPQQPGQPVSPEAATAALANMEAQLAALLDGQSGVIGKGGASTGKAVVSAIVATLTAVLVIVPVIKSVVPLPGQSCPAQVVFDPNGATN